MTAMPSNLSRRQLLGAGATAAATLPLLAACGGSSSPSAGASSSPDMSKTDRTLAVSNWTFYIDVEPGHKDVRPTLEAFEKKYGITVEYTEDIADN